LAEPLTPEEKDRRSRKGIRLYNYWTRQGFLNEEALELSNILWLDPRGADLSGYGAEKSNHRRDVQRIRRWRRRNIANLRDAGLNEEEIREILHDQYMERFDVGDIINESYETEPSPETT